MFKMIDKENKRYINRQINNKEKIISKKDRGHF